MKIVVKGWRTLRRNSCANHNIMGVVAHPLAPRPSRLSDPCCDPRIILFHTMDFFYKTIVSHIGVKYPAGCSYGSHLYLAKRTSTN